MTVVPEFRPVRSSVSPAGTVIPLRTMLEQEVLLALALAASVNVQAEALLDVVLVLLGAAAASPEKSTAAAAERMLDRM